jgi:hypothetical protein
MVIKSIRRFKALLILTALVIVATTASCTDVRHIDESSSAPPEPQVTAEGVGGQSAATSNPGRPQSSLPDEGKTYLLFEAESSWTGSSSGSSSSGSAGGSSSSSGSSSGSAGGSGGSGHRVYSHSYFALPDTHIPTQTTNADAATYDISTDETSSRQTPSARSSPRYRALLTNEVVARHTEQLLFLAASAIKSDEELAQLLSERRAAGSPPHAKRSNNSNIDDSYNGKLQPAQWNKFAYILPKITCPQFLICSGNIVPIKRQDDPLVWDWILSSAKWDADRRGYVVIAFYGSQSESGTFDERIEELPPIAIDVQTFRDMSWLEQKLQDLHKVLDAIHADILGLVAIFTVLGYWARKLIFPITGRRSDPRKPPAQST